MQSCCCPPYSYSCVNTNESNVKYNVAPTGLENPNVRTKELSKSQLEILISNQL